jgi:hypothetical protein
MMGDDHWEQLTYLYNNIPSIGLGYFSSHEVHLVEPLLANMQTSNLV